MLRISEGVCEGVGALELTFPEGKRLDQDTEIHQDLDGDTGHVDDGRRTVALGAA